MKAKLIYIAAICFLAIIICVGCGMFSKNFTVGSDPVLEDITGIDISHGDMATASGWHYNVIKSEENGIYIEADFYEDDQQKNGIAAITEYDWNELFEIVDGSKVVASGDDPSSVQLSWKDVPDGNYYLEFAKEDSFDELADKAKELVNFYGIFDIDKIQRVSFGHSGDEMGSSSNTSVFLEDGKWYAQTESYESYDSEPELSNKEISDDYIGRIKDILKQYSWEGWKSLPEGDLMILDGPTKYLSMDFEDTLGWSIDEWQELPDQAQEMWDKLEAIINEACK